MKKICVMGCGYVGLVSGAGLAQFGNSVTCFDIDKGRIDNLNNNQMPIYEPGLSEIVEKNCAAGKLSFCNNLESAVKDCDAVLIAVQTPQDTNGNANLKYLYSAASDIAEVVKSSLVVVIKSTVPVGTAKEVHKIINSRLNERNTEFSAEIVSNPEFLIEGRAVDTFLNPDRIVVGCNPDGDACKLMKSIYKTPCDDGREIVICNNETAETIKYAANSFLAMKISFINQMALLCQKTGADIETVAKALGSDSRINPKFFKPGPGYGGSCFPKDTKALVYTGNKFGVDMSLVRETDDSNEKHKQILAEKIITKMRSEKVDTLAVWGLAFKAGTGDLRDSPALTILKIISEAGLNINAFDPEAMPEAKKWIKKNNLKIDLKQDMYTVLEGSDALLIITEWDCFKKSDIQKICSAMDGKMIFDFRNILNKEEIRNAGCEYFGVGR